MTVAEYIKALQKLPQNAECLQYDDYGNADPIDAPFDVFQMHRVVQAYASSQREIGETYYAPCHRRQTCKKCVAGVPLVQVVVL